MITAAIYVRQSIDKSEGIDRQLARCRALAESRGWTVIEELEDNAVSAYKARGAGTAWAQLLASEADVVVAVNMDRLLRGQADLLKLVESGLLVATVEGDLDLTTAEGRFRAELLTSLASFEGRKKGERQVRANESRVALGLPVPGKRRFGFEPGNIVERKEEADLVRWAYDRVLAGQSVRSISKAFGNAPVRVRETLSNPSYAGWVVRRGERFEAHSSVARVVDRDVWLAVQDLLSDEARKVSPGNQRKHFLSGLAKCECGAGMRVVSRYYQCSADYSHATIYRSDLEPYVKEKLALALFDEYEESAELAPLARRLAELEEERSRWTEVAGLPGADMAKVKKELARIAAEAEAASAELGRSRVAGSTIELAERAREALLSMTSQHALDLSEWTAYFDAQDLDAQRGLVESKLSVQVAKGKGLGRVSITPR